MKQFSLIRIAWEWEGDTGFMKIYFENLSSVAFQLRSEHSCAPMSKHFNCHSLRGGVVRRNLTGDSPCHMDSIEGLDAFVA